MTNVVSLSYGGLPAMYRMTDRAAAAGQRRTVARTVVYLVLLVVAALGGVLHWTVRNDSLDLGGLLSFAAFLGALVLGLSTAAAKPEEQWYKARAAAESVKTLAWRYAVCGDPFLQSDVEVDALYMSRSRDLVDQLRGIEFGLVESSEQITNTMRTMRALSLEERRRAYISGRIDDQITWYSAKATVNARRARQWAAIAASATLAGVVLGFLRMVTILEADYLSLFAAIAASVNAWIQMRQHRTLATSYGVAAQELSLTKTAVSGVSSEAEWARVVSDAEDAVSREHTMWLARRSVASVIP